MKKLLILIFFIFIWSSCQEHNDKDAATTPKLQFTGEIFGTYYSVAYFDADSINYQKQIESLLEEVDFSLSIYNPFSLVSKINQSEGGKFLVDKYFKEVMNQALNIFEKTEGACDVTVGPLVNAWGFGFKNKKSMDSSLVDSLLRYVGVEHIIFDGDSIEKRIPEVVLDFNAIAKGYGVDIVADFFKEKGIQSFIVDIGGEVFASGIKPNGEKWKIGIEKPSSNKNSDRQLQAVIALRDMAVATSGNYRNYYIKDGKKYAHTIDPKTGFPIQHSLLSASVFAGDCLTADAYATAFMVLGLDRSIQIVEADKELEAFFIYDDPIEGYKTYATSAIKKMLED